MDQAASFIVILLVMTILAIFRKVIFPKYAVVQPYQNGLLTNKGVFEKVLSPGGYWMPRWKNVTVVDMRGQVLNVAGQEVLSTDGISVKVSVAGEYSVAEADKTVFLNLQPATNLYFYAQAAIREVMAKLTFEEILQGRGDMNQKLLEIVAPQAKALGFTLGSLQIRDIMLSGELKRAYAQALTAQKDGVASLERARGETAALRSLANAARLMEETPALLHLRALQTMETSKGNTLVFGIGKTGLVVRPKE